MEENDVPISGRWQTIPMRCRDSSPVVATRCTWRFSKIDRSSAKLWRTLPNLFRRWRRRIRSGSLFLSDITNRAIHHNIQQLIRVLASFLPYPVTRLRSSFVCLWQCDTTLCCAQFGESLHDLEKLVLIPSTFNPCFVHRLRHELVYRKRWLIGRRRLIHDPRLWLRRRCLSYHLGR